MSSYCVQPSCAQVAEPDSERCSAHNGHAPMGRQGFTVWNNEAFCAECDAVVQVRLGEAFTTDKGSQGLAVFCPTHQTQL